jgi:peptide/nickel transport system substrate-binding protein
MPSTDWGDVVGAFRTGELSRRDLILQATAAGLSAGAATLLANRVAARQATPGAPPVAGASPSTTALSATGAAEPGGRSINREEYYQLIRRSFDLSEPEVTGGQVIYGASADIDTLNPQLFGDILTGYVVGAIYEWLVGVNPTNGFPAPGLADYWELAEDGRTYTFHLNPNAAWHDGVPVTAADIVFSFDAALDESSLGSFQSSVGRVLESYRAVDDHTVELVSRTPLAVFIENTAALVGIVPKHIWEGIPPSDWGTDPGSTGQDPARVIGSGPFRFIEWVAGDHVTLARNDDYWDPDGVPYIDEFIYRVIPETYSATAALTTGEVDFSRVSLGEIESLEDNPDVNIVAHDDTGWTVLNINQDPEKTELFVDIPVRQALMYAIDRQLIAEEIFFGYASKANGTQPKLSIAYDESRVNTIYNYDPEKARQLLEEAGWVDSDGDGVREKDGVRFSFECFFADNVPPRRLALVYIQQAWGEVGIDMTPVGLPFQTFFDVLTTGEYEMGIHGTSWGVDGGQGDMFRCDAAPPAGSNFMKYCNERYDELDDLQMAELDVEKRIDLLIEASNIVNDEVAAGVLLFNKSVFGSRATLHNFLPNGYSYLWSMPWWWTEVQ